MWEKTSCGGIQWMFSVGRLLWRCVGAENRDLRWTTLLLPTLHVCCRHGEHSTGIQRLPWHHSTHAPAPVRASMRRRFWTESAPPLYALGCPSPRDGGWAAWPCVTARLRNSCTRTRDYGQMHAARLSIHIWTSTGFVKFPRYPAPFIGVRSVSF